MTRPLARTRSLVQAKELLEAMMNSKQTPSIPRWICERAKTLLKHYPGLTEIERALQVPPATLGSVPQFSRLSVTVTTHGVIEAMKGKPEAPTDQ